MSDIVERLRFRADENYEMLGNIHEPLLEAAAEIERLRAGGCARDQGTTQYCAEAAKLAAENERLRAALRSLVGAVADHTSQKSIPDALREARAALEGRT